MDTLSTVFDVAVIGAGMAGLICAQHLRQAGYSVVVIEKSRGPGGRVATRRLHDTRADHGARYLEPQGERLQQLIEIMRDRGILKLWTDNVYEFGSENARSIQNRYVPAAGMNSIGKFLANNLEIWFCRRAIAVTPTDSQTWHLTLEAVGDSAHPAELTAAAVVVAIPAPQALMLLTTTKGLTSDFLDKIRSVEYYPCITAIAGYSPERDRDLAKLNPGWKAISFSSDSHLAWMGLDSSKREKSQQPIFVIQSSASFAENYLEVADLQQAGKQLLERAGEYIMPWLSTPEWLQVHRWRYAFCQNPLPVSCLATTNPHPLVCAGDWCRGNQIEGALNSGAAAARSVNSMLANNSLPDFNFILRSL